MTAAGGAPDPYEDALLAARLCAIDPRLGGVILRGGGELRDTVVAVLGKPVRRLPPHIDDEALLGGLDLASTLALGRPVERKGLLADAAGGAVVIPMAERLADATAAQIASAVDAGAGFTIVALDDGAEADERAPAALLERAAFWIDLSATSCRHPGLDPGSRFLSEQNSGAPDQVRGDEEVLKAITETALALGVESARAPLFTLRAARAAAALAEREAVVEEDVILAARLVLAPRATRLPAPPEDAAPEPPPPPENNDGNEQQGDPVPLDDIVLATALAALPKDVLARIADGARKGPSKASGAGERRKSPLRGRPMGARAEVPRGGLQLALIDTLRAAAPWQKIRGREGRVRIRRDDLRIRRFETRAEALTIFAVDASGSSALARLAEAKGAVELLLAEAYVKRAQVALVAFRGDKAELLLPPTRSLARARRSLAELPGGGGTPLAAGLNAARELAEAARARGRTPFVVVLTDGRANVAADGSMVRKAATDDAETAARAIGAAGIASAFVDISARPRPEGAALAQAMRARYLPLPRADAAQMHAAVTAARG